MEFTVRSARTRAALALAVAVAATVAADGSLEMRAPEAPVRAELRAVSTRLEGTRSTVLIEASEPVAYVTSQPDPLTVLVDLRNVRGGQMGGVLGPLPPVANVDVEEAVAGDGAPVARVRVSLAHAATHRVRSSRNIIYVEVDRAVVPHDALAPATGMVAPAAASANTAGALAPAVAQQPPPAPPAPAVQPAPRQPQPFTG